MFWPIHHLDQQGIAGFRTLGSDGTQFASIGYVHKCALSQDVLALTVSKVTLDTAVFDFSRNVRIRPALHSDTASRHSKHQPIALKFFPVLIN